MSRRSHTAQVVLSVCALLVQTTPAQAEAAAVWLTCRVQSGDLRFGALNPSTPARWEGVGVVVLNCENRSQTAQSTVIHLGISATHTPMHANGPSSQALSVAFFLDPNRSQVWGDGHNGGEPLRWPVQLAPGEHRLLRLPVHALLQHANNAPVGSYQVHVPLTLTHSGER